MPTVTEILDRASRITGLRATGTERDLALDALQDVYRRVVMETECSIVSADYTIAASQDEYTLSTILTEQPLKLTHVSINGQGGRVPLQQVSLQELMDLRDTLVPGGGTPYYYATNGFTGLQFYPNPAVGDEITVMYIEDVPTLVESAPGAGQESTPSKVPVQFHYSVLLPAIVLEMLDKDQRLQESGLWSERYEKALGRMHDWIGQFGGEFNRAYVRKGMKRYRYNDQRSRW